MSTVVSKEDLGDVLNWASQAEGWGGESIFTPVFPGQARPSGRAGS